MSDVFRAMNIHVSDFWNVTPCSVVVGYQRFGWPYCLHLQDGILQLYARFEVFRVIKIQVAVL